MQEIISKKVNMQEKRKLETKKENRVKQNSGITLIALVVTIVVLLILAGVSIVVLFGDNGIIKQAGESSLQTKFADVEERANVIYADLDSKRYAEGNTNKKVTMGEIAQELSNLKYDIKEIEVGESVVEAIELEPTSIKMGTNDTATIKVNLKRNEEGMEYYVKVENQYYQIGLENGHVVLDRTNGKTVEEVNKNETTGNETPNITASSSQETIVTVKNINQNENIIEIESKENLGTAQITASYGNITSTPCTITVAIQPQTGVAPDPTTPITTEFGKIDVIWLDKNNQIIPQPEKPILQSKTNPVEGEKVEMQAIKWDGTEEKPADKTNNGNDWYEYKAIEGEEDNNTSHWANAKTENGSYFVWIPRYAYRITYYQSETDHTVTGYYDGNGMWSAKDGAIKYALKEGIETVEAEDGNKYIVHPAFGAKPKQVGETDADYTTRKTQNINNGGWGEPLAGFWFAKFEMSGTESTNLASTPGVQSLRSRTIGEFYTIGREATYGQTGTVDSFDNKTSFMNSHMAKNSEWGAVAYLTHSQYGRNGHEITMNSNSSFYTGGAQGETAYTNANNQKQSTTGNTYGIYDMSGGAYEYTAAWNTNTSSYISYGSTFATTGGASTKYATAYHGTSNNYGTDIYTVCKTGDATKEVYVSGATGWFNDYSYFVYSSLPFFERGGHYINGSSAGVFYSYSSSGSSNGYHSFRAVLGFEAL